MKRLIPFIFFMALIPIAAYAWTAHYYNHDDLPGGKGMFSTTTIKKDMQVEGDLLIWYWILCDPDSAAWHNIVACREWDPGEAWMVRITNSEGDIRLVLSCDGSADENAGFNSDICLPDGAEEWHFVTHLYNYVGAATSAVSHFMDGSLIDEDTGLCGPLHPNTAPIDIFHSVGNNPWEGGILYVGIAEGDIASWFVEAHHSWMYNNRGHIHSEIKANAGVSLWCTWPMNPAMGIPNYGECTNKTDGTTYRYDMQLESGIPDVRTQGAVLGTN